MPTFDQSNGSRFVQPEQPRLIDQQRTSCTPDDLREMWARSQLVLQPSLQKLHSHAAPDAVSHQQDLQCCTGMSSSAIAVFSEPQAFESALQQGCGVELLVTGCGQFRAQLISIVLPRLCLFQAEEWLSRIAVVSAAQGSMLVMLPTAPKQSHKSSGVSLLADEIMTVSGGERLHTWAVGSCDWGIISVSAKELAEYGQALVGRYFVLPPGVCRVRPSRAGLQSLLALFNATMRLTEVHPGRPVETEAAAHGLEQEAIRVLVDCFSTGVLQGNEEAYRYSATMANLDRFLQTCRHGIPRIPDVCAALGISAKFLQACCQRQVGVGPGRYFHLRAMRQAHKALIDAQPRPASVVKLAKCYGFNHPGRSAAAHRRQFAELQSVTLRRNMGQCCKSGRVPARQRLRGASDD